MITIFDLETPQISSHYYNNEHGVKTLETRNIWLWFGFGLLLYLMPYRPGLFNAETIFVAEY